MEKNTSWEAKSHSTGKIGFVFMETKAALPCSHDPATDS